MAAAANATHTSELDVTGVTPRMVSEYFRSADDVIKRTFSNTSG